MANRETSLIERIEKVRLIAFDVDGVLTDGGIYLGENGETKRFHVQDGLGLSLARCAGLSIVWITGRKSEAVRRRAAELQIDECHQSIKDKIGLLEQIGHRLEMTLGEMAYMGDDLIDLPVMRKVGLAIAPANAVQDVKSLAHYVTIARGGHGAAREVVETILRRQGKWGALVEDYLRNTESVEQ